MVATDRSEAAAAVTDRFSSRLLLAAALVTVAPLWCAKYLPFTDLPEHVAAIATLRHWADPAWATPETYVLAAGKSQYLAYHALGALLAFPLGSAELANRVLMTIAGLALPYGVRALLRASRADERLAILACPLFWSRPLVIGFLPYVLGVPVLLFTLARVMERRRTDATLRDDAKLAALALLVFYLHLSAFAVLVLVGVALELVPRAGFRWQAMPRRLVWLAPPLVAALVWAFVAEPEGGPALLSNEAAVFYAPKRSLGALFAAWTHDVWVSHVDEYAGVAFWGLVLWLGIQRKTAEPEGSWAVVARLVPFGAVLLLFLVLPFKVGAGAMLNVRLSVLLGLFVLLLPRPDRDRRAPFVLGAVLTLVVAVNAIVEIRGTQRELGDLDRVLANVRPGARVLGLHFERASSYTHSAAWVHALAYHRSRQGGVASVSFSEMRHWPIQYRPEVRPPKKKAMFWDFEPCLFRNSVDGLYYDYVVSRGDTFPFSNDPPGPAWRRVADVDRWHVFEKIPGETTRGQGLNGQDVGPCTPDTPVEKP